MSSLASGGDLFDQVAESGESPGMAREALFAPLVIELFSGLTQLHNLQIVHRDISLENVLLTSSEVSESSIKIIDFGMASTVRSFRNRSGKASYQAPEMHAASEHDAFLADMFAAGVLVYALMVKDYPWLSTKVGSCKCFDYCQKKGFRAYCAKRKVRGSDMAVSACISESLMHLLEGMLEFDPAKRFTFGERFAWAKERRSLWDEPWVRNITTQSGDRSKDEKSLSRAAPHRNSF
jgi:serine/threonine protein kinase